MRMAFGAVSLLIVVAIIGLLAKKQLGAVSGAPPAATATQGVTAPTGTPKQQVDQVKQSVESLMQQPRPATDETK